jgi:PBSX family phage terminase large subunit
MDLKIQLSRNMFNLFLPPARYRVAYGGRNGQKSYGYCDMALKRMVEKRTDIAVCREFQSTIKKSVHKLITERIEYHGLNEAFKITDNSIIYNPNGSKIVFQHLHDNYQEVRGLEGSDVCWVFEGQSLSKESWMVLNPTIRKTPRMETSPEFWIEFNPDFEDDFIFQEFIVNTPKNCIIKYMTYLDNPWCPEEQIYLADQCKAQDLDEYNHTWLGYPRNIGGLVYPMFNPDVHVRDVDLTRIEYVANFFMGQDPHTAYYPFCAWLGRHQKGDGTFDYYWYNEWPTKQTFQGKLYHEVRQEKKCTMTLMERAKIIRMIDNTVDRTYHGINIMARGIDTRFAKGSGAGSTTNNTRGIILEMADQANGGLQFETPPEYMIDGQRDRIRELLNYDNLIPVNAFNEPKMYVLPHCVNLIDTFKLHRFDRDGKDKEDDKRKDPSDAMKICMAIEQQYSHIDRTKKQCDIIPEHDTVQDIVNAFTGNGSFANSGYFGKKEWVREATPIS